jgi:hypothetical protein
MPLAAALMAAAAITASAPARAERSLDRTVVRFYAPETGGTANPRFIEERTLAFEARLELMAERADAADGAAYQERHVRAALEHHVAEEILATLAHKLVAESPASKRPGLDEIKRVQQEMTAALLERLGGRPRVDVAAQAEQLDSPDVDALFDRAGLAAWYLDRVVAPILQPSDEQLREVFRTSAHPFRGQPFDQVRTALRRWFVLERVRVAESAFLQAARARTRIIVT